MPDVQGEIARIHVFRNDGYNPFPHPNSRPEFEKESWLRRVRGIQQRHKYVTASQARLEGLADRFTGVHIELIEPNGNSTLLECLSKRPGPLHIVGRVRNEDSWFIHRCHPFCSARASNRSEEHTSELQSLRHLVCRLLL